jgi:membrane-bound lytic murein transglycosylase A
MPVIRGHAHPNEPGVSMRPFRSFVLDQDRGAAIRAPGRTDIYMGVGADAGKMAGFTYSEGKLYYLFAKEGVNPQQSLAQKSPAPQAEKTPVKTVADE